MNRVLAIVNPDCGHVGMIASDGVTADMRARARYLLGLLHAAGYTRFRIRSMDSIKAVQGILAPMCPRCEVDPGAATSPEVQQLVAQRAALIGPPEPADA